MQLSQSGPASQLISKPWEHQRRLLIGERYCCDGRGLNAALQQLTGDYWYSLRCVTSAIFSMALDTHSNLALLSADRGEFIDGYLRKTAMIKV
jgi:hypothetical protein